MADGYCHLSFKISEIKYVTKHLTTDFTITDFTKSKLETQRFFNDGSNISEYGMKSSWNP